MTIIVDPGFTPPPPPVEAVSVDGRLRALADNLNGGALLVANFAEQVLRTNRMRNPELTTNTTDWTATAQLSGTAGVARVTSGGPTVNGRTLNFYRQTWSAVTTGALSSTGIIFGTPSADAMVLVPGVPNTVSVLARSSVAARTALLVVTSHTSAGANQIVEGSTAATPIGAGWVLLAVTFTPAAGQVRGYARVYNVAGPSHVIGDTLDATAAMVTLDTGAYFSGADSTTPDVGHRWTGPAGASASEEFIPALDPLPRRVRFQRADGTLVRSGDVAYAPGGIAVAYDHEAPLGGSVSWVATPIAADGTEGATTASVALALDGPAPSRMWLKALVDPDLSQVLRVAAAEEDGRLLRSTLSPVAGSALPGGGWDVPLGWAGRITFRTDTEEEYQQLLAVLSTGTVLMQVGDCAGLPTDLYLLPQGSLAAVRMPGAATGQGWKYRTWQVSFTQVPRPSTVGAPLIIPGVSWDDVRDGYASWDGVELTVPSWLALLGAA